MLTGDLNVALVPWIVQYRIKNPYDYLFKVRNVRRILIDMSEASMRLVVGDRSIDEVINKRDEIAVEARGLLQRELDHAETGIHIVTIEMKKTNVPERVQPSFNEVNQAEQDQQVQAQQQAAYDQGAADAQAAAQQAPAAAPAAPAADPVEQLERLAERARQVGGEEDGPVEDPELHRTLASFAESFGGHPFDLADEAKALYHAAAASATTSATTPETPSSRPPATPSTMPTTKGMRHELRAPLSWGSAQRSE